jgi:hypothetical protein
MAADALDFDCGSSGDGFAVDEAVETAGAFVDASCVCRCW